MELNATPRVSLNFKRIYNRKWESIFVELLAVTSSSSDDLPILGLSRQAIGANLLDIDNHICRIKFIDIEVKEFVD